MATTSSPTYSKERVTLARAWCGLTMRPAAAVRIARRGKGDCSFMRPSYRTPRVAVSGRTYQKSGISRQNPLFSAARPLSGLPHPRVRLPLPSPPRPALAQPRRASLENGSPVGETAPAEGTPSRRGDRQGSGWGSRADLLRVGARLRGSMGWRELRVTGIAGRAVLRTHSVGSTVPGVLVRFAVPAGAHAVPAGALPDRGHGAR